MIVCPMEKEAEAVRRAGPDADVVAIGIGKAASAIETARLLAFAKPERVLLVGCAGAVDGRFRQGSIVVPDVAVEWDFDDGSGAFRSVPVHRHFAHEVRAALGLRPLRNDLTVATGDRFSPKDPRVAASGAAAVDMETAAVAMACMGACVPFCAVRVVSDTPDDPESYRRFWSDPEKWFEFVRNIPEGLR